MADTSRTQQYLLDTAFPDSAAPGSITPQTMRDLVVSISAGNLTTPYTLPTASETVLGGVKVDGTTVTIEEDGTVSVPAAAPYTLPAATISRLGGVKPDGSTITVAGDGTLSSDGLVRSDNLTDLPDPGIARQALGAGSLTNFGPGASPMVCCNMGTMLIPANPGTAGDTVNNTLNSQKLCQAPLLSGVSDIQLALPAWASTVNNGVETDLPTGFSAVGSIEYPIGSAPRRVYVQGAPNLTVAAGRNLPKFDPLPIFIPAGQQFLAKLCCTWTAGSFWYAPYASYALEPEWTNLTVGGADHTLDNTVLTQTTPGSSFAPLVFGRLQNAIPVIGVLGDSIGNGGTDLIDPVTLSNFWGRGLRNKLPVMNQSTGGYTMAQYLARQEGLNLVFRQPNSAATITHLIMELGTNDVFAGETLAQMQANFQAVVNPFLARSVKVYACTLLPRTTSTDGWISLANQGWFSGAFETVRLAYNAWLRTNWQALGLSGLIDMCLAVDPNDIGKWGCDPGITNVPTAQGACFATVSGGAVATIFRGTGYAGAGYPDSTTLPLTTYPYPGQTGAGATGIATTNSIGQIISANMVTPGVGYSDIPMVNILGPWTLDGTHPTSRGCNEIIFRAPILTASGTTIGYGPGIFSL